MVHSDPGLGHFGIKRTLDRLRPRAYWPSMTAYVTKFCASCEKCQSRKQPARKPRAPLVSYRTGVPNERVQIDIVGPLVESYRMNKYLIVMTDCFTKWANAYPVRRATAIEVANALQDWVSQFGVMKIIHSDQGTQFEATVVQQLCHKLGIVKTRTTSYHPQGDGQVERLNRTLMDILSKYGRQSQKDWDEHIPMALLAYRSCANEVNKISPAMMTYGRELNLPVDLIYGVPPSSVQPGQEPHQYVAELEQAILKVHEIARTKMLKAANRQKKNYDLKQYKNNYKKGDLVWLFTPAIKKNRVKKLSSRWNGPYQVVEPLSDVLIKIRRRPRTKELVVHHNRLKPYYRQM